MKGFDPRSRDLPDFILGISKEIWEDRGIALMASDMASVPTVYDRGVQLEMPGGVTGHGWPAVDGFWLRLRSAFPSAEFRIHHQIGREDRLMPPRAALRWSLWGRHDGFGAFGPPTGAQADCHATWTALIPPSPARRGLETRVRRRGRGAR